VQGRPVKWSSGDSAIIVVTPSGAATATGTGRTTLTASMDGYASSVSAEVVLTPATVKLLSGFDQRAPAGRRLPEPIQLQVISRGGRPVPDAPVTFATAGDEGAVEPAKATTDRNGRARASWTLGVHPGRQRLLASVAGLDSVLGVVAEADPVPKSTHVQPAREAPSGAAGARLPEPVGIRVTGVDGAAATDVPVAWTALDGGRIEPQSPRTDSLGEAWAFWTLGSRAGTQHARAQVGNPRTMPVFTVTATALAETPATVELLGGGGQDGRVGTSLRKPIVVRLADRYGNPVGGGMVRVVALAGSVADTAPVADAQGRVQIRWTLGSKAGAQALELTPGTSTPTRVSARALALEPANIALGSLPASAPAGRALAKPITAEVTDAYGNTVPDVQVIFSTASGSVSPARVMTDAKGAAATHWTLGAAAGDQTLSATVRGTTVKASASVEATKSTRH
jgi:Bacterial Ig-like domain (group 1)